MKKIIEIENISLSYREKKVIEDLSLSFETGEFCALLGPNGAVKTTMLETLEGIRASDGGVLQVMGADPARESHKLRNLSGVQLQTSGIPDSMRVDSLRIKPLLLTRSGQP